MHTGNERLSYNFASFKVKLVKAHCFNQSTIQVVRYTDLGPDAGRRKNMSQCYGYQAVREILS